MTIRADAMLLTHGREGTDRMIGAALLLDAALGGQIDIERGYLVDGGERADSPLVAELRARVMSGPPESVSAWIDRAALFAPRKVAAELVAAGVAAPLERRFARRFTLSVDARAEAAARARADRDPVLGALLQSWPLPPATHTLPPAVQAILARVNQPAAPTYAWAA
ncbi:MAG TPA: GPP34 family phosphoprotein [Solirubrobacter sp.]|nr:GPP34 family phosphoprotein [Solirubrobacter sp.]